MLKQSSQRKPDERHEVNLSLKQLTTAQLQVLSRGLNFAAIPKFIPKAHIVASVEAAITQSNVTEGEAAKARVGVTNCRPFWLPHKELTSISSVHHHPECAGLRSVSVFQYSVSFHLCANLPSHPGYPWPFDEWPISSRQAQPHRGWHLLPSTLPGGHLPGIWRRSIPADPRHVMGSPVLVVVANLVMEDVE